MACTLLLALGVCLLGVVEGTSRTSPPAGCITVGESEDFTTIQSAVDSLSTTDTAAQCIFIFPGTYSEQVLVDERAAQLTLYGSTEDTSSYASNTVTITSALSQLDGLSNDETATLRAHNTGMKVYNIDIVNSFGEGSQAVALSVEADEQSFYGVSLIGYQDTVLADTGNEFFANSFIQGRTDFVFGMHAVAWFENVTINPIDAGYITANGRDAADNPSFYVFNSAVVTGTAAAGSVYLGRPWRNFSRVVFQDSVLSDVINAAGWSIWDPGNPQTNNVVYMEYENTGAGAAGTRASFAGVLEAPETIDGILGSDYASWVDTSYL